MKRLLGKLTLAATLLGCLLVIASAAFGIPAPPSATVSGVPRLPWAPAWTGLQVALDGLGSTQVAAWNPTGGIYVRTHHRLEPRLHHIAEPAGPVEPVAVPPRAGRLSPSPDASRRYAVYTLDEGGNERRRIFRWDLDTGESTALTPAGANAWLGPWSRDGSRIAFATNERSDADRDIYVMDPAQPQSATRVFEGRGSWSAVDFSPDGSRLLVSEYVSVAHSRPHIVDLASGQLRPLVDLEPPSRFSNLRFSADPEVVFAVTDRDSEFARLVTVDLATGDLQPLGPPTDWDVMRVVPSTDRTELAVSINEDGVRHWYLLDGVTGSRRPLTSPSGAILGLAFHPERRALAMTVQRTDGLTSVSTVELDDGLETVWTTNDEPEAEALPVYRLVRYPTFDEVDGRPRMIPAFVFDPPASAPAPAPVLIRIHGGPEGQSRGGANALYDVLRRELGVVIVTPNVRGSTGYGKTYVGLDNGRHRQDSVRDIGALLEWIETQPQYDADRVIVYGGSYGGYMVLASLVHYPDRIRCGVDVVGISNFVSFLENTKEYRRQLRRNEYGDERDPSMRAFLESISPLTAAETIEADLLVIQGANDPRVPVEESRQIVERLRALGREVWYLEFEDEGHGVRMPVNNFYVAMVGHAFARRCLER